MNKLSWIVPFFIGFYYTVFAQEVYRVPIANEYERRSLYQLEDWIGYSNFRHIRYITMDNTTIYFASYGGGIWRLNKYTQEWEYPFTTCNGLPDNYVKRVYYDRKQNILIAITETDTAVFDFGRNLWLSLKREGYLPYQIEIQIDIPAGREDQGYFYEGYQEELGTLPLESTEYFYQIGGKIMDSRMRQYPVTGYFIDDFDRVYLPVEGLGLITGTRRRGFYRVIQGGLANIIPRSFFFHQDAIWVGGHPVSGGISGIVRWQNDNQFFLYRQGDNSQLVSDEVTYITGTDSVIYFGTDRGILRYFISKDRWGVIGTFSGLRYDRIYCLLTYGPILYIGTDQGLFIYDHKKGKATEADRKTFRNISVYDMAQYRDTIYLATSVGICFFNDSLKSWQFLDKNIPFPSLEFTAIAVNDDEIWTAGRYGIGVYRKSSGKWDYFPYLLSQVGPPYYDLVTYEKGVFLATSHGLLQFDRSRNFWQWYTTDNGLLDNRVYQLYTENGYLWMVTHSGICQFHYRRLSR